MIDDECGAVGGMRICRGNRSTQRKPAPVPLCPPQVSHNLTWARTQVAAVGKHGELVLWKFLEMLLPCITSTKDTDSPFQSPA
jgi:hypothetical protein